MVEDERKRKILTLNRRFERERPLRCGGVFFRNGMRVRLGAEGGLCLLRCLKTRLHFLAFR